MKLQMTAPSDGSLIFPLQKVLFDTDQGPVSLALTTKSGQPELCLRLPDDSLLFLSPDINMDMLESIMEGIVDYEGNY